jgi:hypothetical protein
MEYKIIPLLDKTARARLASLKALAARYQHYGDMRQIYRQGFQPLTIRHYPINANDPERAARRVFQSELDVGFRRVGWSDEKLNLRHTGWYADNYQEETFRGVVFRLPAKRGQERFVAGYVESMNDGFVLDLSEVWDNDLIGAVREADRLAERAAEDARMFAAKDAANMRIENIAEELKDIRAEIMALCRSIREACPGIEKHKPIRSALRSALQALLRNRTSLIAERDRLEGDYWSVVANW